MMIAVMEPLEVTLRAQLRHMGRSQVMVAVIEPLEVVVRPQFGHTGRSQVYDCCNGALRGISKGLFRSRKKK